MNTHILLLAAGSSSRMGQSKQLMKIQGIPMLVHAVREAAAACPNVTVVLGSEADAHREVLKGLRVNTIENSEWQRGMGNSLKYGLAALRDAHPEMDAVLVMVCDQPAVSAGHLKKILALAEHSSRPVTASSYKETLGVPALFRRELFDSLAVIADSAGASKLVRKHASPADTIPLIGGETDLDTINDYLQFTGRDE